MSSSNMIERKKVEKNVESSQDDRNGILRKYGIYISKIPTNFSFSQEHRICGIRVIVQVLIDFDLSWSTYTLSSVAARHHICRFENHFNTLHQDINKDAFVTEAKKMYLNLGAKVFSKPKFIREGPMRNSVATKRTKPMDMREPAKRPMRYDPTLNKVPVKRLLPVKKVATKQVIKKDVLTKNSGAVIVGKPVLNKDLIRKAPETKPKAGETSKNIPATSKTSTSSSITKAVTKAAVKEERKDDAKDKTRVEYQELSPLLSCALDSELEDIMIKVWQELPDEPSSKVEEHVVEKIRNEAGDDLRNVIGLNITKRLLNITNSLYAKLIFNMRPERGALMDFIKKYKLKTFKRISDESPIFAAQFSNYEDYDRVCKDRVVYCGEVRVNVKACYNYRTCPLNLRTVFSQHDKNTTNSNNDKESDVKLTNEASQGKIPVIIKESEKIQDVKSNETSTNVSVKTETTNETKSVTNIGTKIDRIIIKIEKEEDGRNNSDKGDKINKSEISNSIMQVAQVKTEPTEQKEENEKVDEVNKSQTANTEVQDTQTNINIPNEIQVKTEPSQDKEENEKVDKANEEQIDNLQTITQEAITQTNIKQEKEGNEKFETKDDEKKLKETNNENEAIEEPDVLALISEGIVLDECSGSDIE